MVFCREGCRIFVSFCGGRGNSSRIFVRIFMRRPDFWSRSPGFWVGEPWDFCQFFLEEGGTAPKFFVRFLSVFCQVSGGKQENRVH